MPQTTKFTIGFTMDILLLDGFDPPQIVQRNTLQKGDRYRHLSAYASWYALGSLVEDNMPFEIAQPTDSFELVVGWRKIKPITPADGWQPIDKITNVDNKKWPLVILGDGLRVGSTSCCYTDTVKSDLILAKNCGFQYFLVIDPPTTNK